jgi:transcriptional regulator with GAF, ATPase, and Fis domain/serine/threonine protein kinase
MHSTQQPEYQFEELLSDHFPFRSWRAVNRQSGSVCFLKCILSDGPLAADKTVQHVIASLRLQKDLASGMVVKARQHRIESGMLVVEYPWLDPSKWQRLSTSNPADFFEKVLPGICLILDYIHWLGYVHGDVKLDNFLASTNGHRDRIRLIDLDFLCRNGTRPHARLLGSPGHIAPEIVADDCVVCQSDAYSLGVSLGLTLAHPEFADSPGNSVLVERLKKLVASLTEPNYLQRPRSLLESCRTCGLLTDQQYDGRLKELFKLILFTQLRRSSRSEIESPDRLFRFLSERCCLYGLSPDLIERISTAIKSNRFGLWRAVWAEIRQGSLQRFDQFWLIKFSDDALNRLYAQLDRIIGDRPGLDPADPVAVFRDCDELHHSGKHERAYLGLHQLSMLINDCSSTPARQLRQDNYLLLGNVASQLNRQSESFAAYKAALGLLDHSDSRFVETLNLAVFAGLRANLLADVELLFAEHSAFADSLIDPASRVKILQSKAWIHYQRKDLALAHASIREFRELAERASIHDMAVAAQYLEALVLWRLDHVDDAMHLMESALEHSQKMSSTPQLTSLAATLASFYSEQSRYVDAIRVAKLVFKKNLGPNQVAASPSLYSAIMFAYVRIAEFPKARYWLQRFLSAQQPDQEGNRFLTYFVLNGVVSAEEGAVAAAEDSFSRAHALLTPRSTASFVGKLYQNIALINIWRGRPGESTRYIELTRKSLPPTGNTSTHLEVDLIEEIALQTEAGEPACKRLVDMAMALRNANSRYYSALGWYYSICFDPGSVTTELCGDLAKSFAFQGYEKVPLFAALIALTDYYKEPAKSAGKEEIAAWKRAFVALSKGRQLYASSLAALRLADAYEKRGQERHARKFLLQARNVVISLHNVRLLEKLDQRLARLASSSSSRTQLVDSFLAMSELVNDIGEFRPTLQRLVQFAVEQTGAERGILFLKSASSSDLQIGAAINCDDNSLADLCEFSAHLPWQSITEQSALLIDNALADKRTNCYESIVRHNILSVACIPLSANGVLQGVLYLDHHSIPALFEAEDLKYMTAVGNFLSRVLSTAREFRGLSMLNVQLMNSLDRMGRSQALITADPFMLELLDSLPRIACTSASVLLQGESGTGKEVICELLHKHSQRTNEPLVKLNCTAIAPTLLESELFGIARSVATGVAERDGKLVAADGGTMYLDEIGDMPPEIQAKILRVIEYQQFEKVGSTRPIRTDIRFIYATNRNLKSLVKQGKFREDLYYRVSTIVLDIPPLRQRPGDIPLLLDHFVQIFKESNRPPRFTPDAIDTLMKYHWPGNVRELRNFAERICILSPGRTVDAKDLPSDKLDFKTSEKDLAAQEAAEKARIHRALVEAKGNQSKAARALRIPLSNLRRRLKKFGISYPK